MLFAFDLDDAHPTRPDSGELGLVAQGGDLDVVVATDLQDGLSLEALDDAAVHFDPDAGRGLRPLWRLRIQQALGQRIGVRPGARGRDGAALGALSADLGVGHRGASVAAGTGRSAGSN
jgi:hypothetical protein